MSQYICPVCSNEMGLGIRSWHLQCRSCAYEKAAFEPTINANTSHDLINESARANGLQDLRVSNFETLLNHIKQLKHQGSLLDVGCAHGWFLDLAKPDFNVLGIEPDKAIFDIVAAKDLAVRNGYFPSALSEHEKFDVIVFNDVIEHIPDISDALTHCQRHLNENGLLVLNLPSSGGIFYKFSKFLLKIGIPQFFERMWQKDLPSPHLHYFDTNNLIKLLGTKGFETRIKGTLPTIQLAGLYTRISYTGDNSLAVRLVIYLCVLICLPLLKIMPADIIFVVATKTK
jgi:2-polyprenyl-3-methyl-5-hydroxy-6-metoxy-1,4-benzoquinol methylase